MQSPQPQFSNTRDAASEQHTRPQKHLFADGSNVADLVGSIGLVYHPAAPAGPALLPTEPWETFGYIGYHSIVRAGPSDYRMYYDTGRVNSGGTDFYRYTCMATSSDGIHNWTKPNLGVSTFNGSTANNIVWPRDADDNTHAAGTVFIDTNPARQPLQLSAPFLHLGSLRCSKELSILACSN